MLSHTHEFYMRRALELASKAKGQTSPNPVVGCVLVKNKRIIAEGWHVRYGADHAEVVALKKAADKARQSTLYVTLEPCHHFGRTPPCVDAIIRSGVKEVVIAMKDPNPLTNGRSIGKLQLAGIKTQVGILRKEAEGINEVFIKFITTKMPFVATKTAQTLDGKIATSMGDSRWITSSASRKLARRIRNEFDAILVGINTVLKDNPRLNAANGRKHIKKIVLDSTLKISTQARLFRNTKTSDCFIATTKKAPLSKIQTLEKRGIQIIFCPLKQGQVDITWLFKELASRGITSILIEGGARVVGEALKNDLVDKMYFYIAPKILGDAGALGSITGLRVPEIQRAIFLTDLTFKKIDRDILITAYVHRDH